MPKNLRRTLTGLAVVVAVAAAAFPLLYAVISHVISGSVTGDFVPPEILAPEPPLEGDITMERIRAIAEAVEWPEDDPCPRDGKRDPEACRALVERHAEVIGRLTAWAEDPGPLGPRQREGFGRHAHAPVAVGMTVALPPFAPQLRLADLNSLAAEQAFGDGDRAAGERLLRLAFDLGAYFEHNPSTLLHEMIGVALTNRAIDTALRLTPAESAAPVAAWLPAEAERLRSLRLALGAEWLNLGYFLDHELKKSDPFATGGLGDDDDPGTGSDAAAGESLVSWDLVELAGLYDPVHTRQMHDAFWAHVQRVSTEIPLRRVEIELETWEEMGAVKYFHNPVGRILFTISAPAYSRFGTRVGRSIDRVAALRVILAARAYHAADGRWPASESELDVAWPRSVLNGEPLVWDRDANAILLVPEEEGPCTDEAECRMPFARPGD